jgi:hypothetical protein
MNTVRGDLWEYADYGALVITTNIGWCRDGRNPMGRGVALQAAQRVIGLPGWYGKICKERGAATPVVEYAHRGKLRLLLFPTKPLDALRPHMSWRNRASLALIERGLAQLAAEYTTPVFLPLVGCANGGLREEDVLPLLHQYLTADNFTLVQR